MSGARIGALPPALRLSFCLCAAAAPAFATPSVDDAVSLFRQRRYAEARALLEPIARIEPSNPRASYFLGMSVLREGGPGSLDSARGWLGKATKLAPQNESYLADYAGVCLLLADRDNSLPLAMEGRDDMARAIANNPNDLEARDGLMRFYAKAPWPLGDPNKALSLAADIARIDTKRGAAAYRSLGVIFEKAGRQELAGSAERQAQILAP